MYIVHVLHVVHAADCDETSLTGVVARLQHLQLVVLLQPLELRLHPLGGELKPAQTHVSRSRQRHIRSAAITTNKSSMDYTFAALRTFSCICYLAALLQAA